MLSLNGTWKALTDKENLGEADGFYEIDFDDSDWKPIKVPGHWQEEGFPEYQGILWYRHKFQIPDELKQFFKIIRLRFAGVFYYCKIWLNEEYVGDHEGYFDTFDFNITGLLDKENTLAVKVVCDEEKDRSSKRQITGVFSDWDASDPLFNPGGIWNDVSLVETGPTYIKNLEIKSEIIDETSAKLYFRLEMMTETKGEKKFQLEIQPKNFQGSEIKEEFYEKFEKEQIEVEREIELEDAQFWWTWDHGYPSLYSFKISIFDGEKLSDEKIQTIGLREFKREIKNRIWEFYLNRKRIYIRGSNYAPSSHRVAYITRENIEEDIDLVVEANLNMLRVHAHVDRIEFHEICAEKGVLIWQDFPLQWGYNMKIKETAKDQIKNMARHLQNYPSQGIYCCHNEPFLGMSPKPILFMIIALLISYGLGWLVGFYTGILQNAVFWGVFILATFLFGLIPTSIFVYNKNKDILDKELMEALQEIDDSVPIIKNSGVMGLIRKGTDLHTYEGWYFGKGYRDAYCYTKFPWRRMVPFITEYGAQAFPNLENFKKIIKNGELWPPQWELLKKNHRCQPMFFAVWFNLGDYDNISDFIVATQDYQAELLKFYNELWRINRYKLNGGAIMFLFNDCFPGITWSIVDYWKTPKKAYYATQLSFEPVYVMVDWPKKHYKPNKTLKTNLYGVNDLHEKIQNAKVQWELLNDQETSVSSGDLICTLEEDAIQILSEIEYQFPLDAQGVYKLNLTLTFEETTIQNSYSLNIS